MYQKCFQKMSDRKKTLIIADDRRHICEEKKSRISSIVSQVLLNKSDLIGEKKNLWLD